MYNTFFEEAPGIHRLRVPFEAIYTSVFLVETENVKILVDCGASARDVDEHIIPALLAHGVALSAVNMLVLTHKHGDHAGGLFRVLELAPHVKVITDVCQIAGGIVTYPMAGHTKDCIGVLDEARGTLITGDGLQGAGVDRYRCYTQDPDGYLATIERIRADERIKALLFSHAYEPFYTDRIAGRTAVLDCLAKCVEYVKR